MSGDDSAPGSGVPSSVPQPPRSRILPRQEEGEQRIIEETDQRQAAAGNPDHFTCQLSASASANNSPQPRPAGGGMANVLSAVDCSPTIPCSCRGCTPLLLCSALPPSSRLLTRRGVSPTYRLTRLLNCRLGCVAPPAPKHRLAGVVETPFFLLRVRSRCGG